MRRALPPPAARRLIEENKQLKEKNKEYEINENSKIINKIKSPKLKELIEENTTIKEKNREYEENNNKYTNIQKENEKLSNLNKEINTKNEELQNELNDIKKKYETLLEEENNIKNKKNKNNEINELGDNNDNENEFDEVDDDGGRNRDLYLSRIQDRDFSSPEERKLKEERLKKLFKNKVYEIKDYLHRQFMKFYYNGIFVQMQKKTEGDDGTKVVRSKHFSNLISKFSSNNSNNSQNSSTIKHFGHKNTIQKNLELQIDSNMMYMLILVWVLHNQM